jgi:hypothetical protein
VEALAAALIAGIVCGIFFSRVILHVTSRAVDNLLDLAKSLARRN